MARRAVVIGVNEYENSEKIPSLKGAVNDAKEIREKLEKNGQFEISAFLTGTEATSEKVRRAMSDLLWKKDPCEVALFYFSGHGFQDGYGNGYIAPWDLKYQEPLVRGIKIQELKELFLAAVNKQKALLILDCCHSGIATDEKDLPAPKVDFYQSFSDLGSAAKGSGKFILASSGADEKSREIRKFHQIRLQGELEHEHGVFTFHMLEGMDAGAARKDGVVTLARLQEYVSAKMALNNPQHECTFWGFGKGMFEETEIVTACRKQEIEKLVQNATQNLEAGNAVALFDAIEFLRQAIAEYPDSPDASDLKGKIDATLQKDYQGPVTDWFMKHTSYSRKFREFDSLQRCAADLCFDQIMQLGPDRTAVLGVLFRVAIENFDTPVLENYLKRLESRSAAVQVGKASVDVRGSGS